MVYYANCSESQKRAGWNGTKIRAFVVKSRTMDERVVKFSFLTCPLKMALFPQEGKGDGRNGRNGSDRRERRKRKRKEGENGCFRVTSAVP
jgi:hypothetical protein